MNTNQADSKDEMDLLLLKRKIFKDTSLDCNQYKDKYLKRRINVRMNVRKIETYNEYMQLLKSDPYEYDNLLNDITINVTQFFRDKEVFEMIFEEILPYLIYLKVKNERRLIRIWSAGCASGEEAYSLAIFMHDLLGEEFHNFIVNIHGTDIDDESLNAAKIGKYLPRQLENVPTVYLYRYFTFDGETYEISHELRDMVKFKKQDLFSESKNSHYDLIICRNVIIYFTKEMQEKLFHNFFNGLNQDGYLVIGKTETILGDSMNLFEPVNLKERIYQKAKIK
jgi:chemotaxis protein methyltransferase CheR